MLLKGKSAAKRYRKEIYSSIRAFRKRNILIVISLFLYYSQKGIIKKYIHKREEKEAKAIKEEIESNRTKHKDSVLNLENDFEKKCTLRHSLPYFFAIGF